MTREEARKLIGGYAANILTTEERAALFQAALEDQEIFDALQNDEPLRELLDDQASRAAILQAIEEPARTTWDRSWWFWGCLTGAAAVTALIFVFLIPRRESASKPLPTASWIRPKKPTQPLTSQVPPSAKSKSASRRMPKPPPPPSAQAAAPLLPGVTQSLEVQNGSVGIAGAPRAGAIESPSSLGGRSARLIAASPSIPSRVLRKNASGDYEPLIGEPLKKGDAIRIEARPPVAGRLTLYRREASGSLTPLSAEMPVAAGTSYQLPPDSSLTIEAATVLVLTLALGGADKMAQLETEISLQLAE